MEIILLKYGEIALKGLNKCTFEDILFKNIKRQLKGIGDFELKRAQSTISLEPKNESFDIEQAISRLKKVFGIATISRALVCKKDFEDIKTNALVYFKEVLLNARTFKVMAKRSDKRFHMNSPELCTELGGILLEEYPHLQVDVHNPEVTVVVEIRDYSAYIHAGHIAGAGGIPVGSSGQAALLLSGGIDSPVAGYMMAKRGLKLCAIHFESPPYTSDRAKQKVIDLAKKMTAYCTDITLFVVPFTKIQEEIRKKSPQDLFTVIMRRYMMKVSDFICQRHGALAIITGESLGQVASQTLKAIACTDLAVDMPVLRPLIGMDKTEIIAISRKIDTFDISILPYEDCCTVFTPPHPKTKPNMAEILEAEENLKFEELIATAVLNTEMINIYFSQEVTQ